MIETPTKEKLREYQQIFNSNNLTFGIPFLDGITAGIFKNDIIILSSQTGLGKSELATTVAMHNVKKNKKVYYFALEAFKWEMQFRIIYKLAAMEYLKDHKNERYFPCSFSDYLTNKVTNEKALIYLEDQEEQVEFYSKFLKIKYREKDYGLKDFELDIEKICTDADLIIIDHLQYFDIDDSKENAEITKIVKRISDISKIVEIPIILISHMRKSLGQNKKIVPNIEDIHGTSNIQKIATKVILISPNFSSELTCDGQNYPTLFRVAKNRYAAGTHRYVGLINFNSTSNSYSDEYFLAELDFHETKYKLLDKENYPKWAK